VLPFDRSAKPVPTAVHTLAEMHDTPLKRASVSVPVGFGVAWIDHAVPFHTSASVSGDGLALLDSPTAVHAVALTHDTPRSTVSVAPAGFGVDRTVQVEPFHSSASEWVVLLAEVELPTALQRVGDVQETPMSAPVAAPAGSGVD